MMAVTMPFERGRSRFALLPLVMLVWLGTAAVSSAQAPPPRPESRPEEEAQKAPPSRPRMQVESGPPPPVLLVSADVECRLELDGEPIGVLQKDVVERFTIKEGEHLLQAFPSGVEGPTWKKSIKAPDTGTVTATVELHELLEEWNKEEEENETGRIEVRDRVVIDHQTGLMWARNVSPEMSWEQVQDYCSRLDLEGVSGWRFPVLDELSTLHFADHESPRQEMEGGDVHWTIFGRRRTDTEVQPREIFPAFDHNPVGALWIQGQQERTSCSFLGGFGCAIERKKAQAAVLCVQPVATAAVAAAEDPNGGR